MPFYLWIYTFQNIHARIVLSQENNRFEVSSSATVFLSCPLYAHFLYLSNANATINILPHGRMMSARREGEKVGNDLMRYLLWGRILQSPVCQLAAWSAMSPAVWTWAQRYRQSILNNRNPWRSASQADSPPPSLEFSIPLPTRFAAMSPSAAIAAIVAPSPNAASSVIRAPATTGNRLIDKLKILVAEIAEKTQSVSIFSFIYYI